MTSPIFRARTRLRRVLLGVVLAAVFSIAFAALFVIAAFLTGLGTVPVSNLLALPLIALPFASLGALYGTIFALDGPLQRGRARYTTLRVAVSALCGAVIVFAWQTPAHVATSKWLALGGAVGAVLGIFGWRWAKYVDF